MSRNPLLDRTPTEVADDLERDLDAADKVASKLSDGRVDDFLRHRYELLLREAIGSLRAMGGAR